MQIDNPTSPLQVLYSVLNPNEDKSNGSDKSDDNGIQTGVGKEERYRRERTAGRLMALVSNNPHPIPPSMGSYMDHSRNKTDDSYSIPPIPSYPPRNPHSTLPPSHSHSSLYSVYPHPNSRTYSVSYLPPLPGGNVISPTS